jgi:hypothetical protein
MRTAMPTHRRWTWAGVLAICLVLAGCNAFQPTASTANSATPAPLVTPTAILATATSTPATITTAFTCESKSVGALKLFNDTSMQLSFSYPATWTEKSCQRVQGPGSQQTLVIGNLFNVTATPRNGQSIERWVQAQTNQYEVVTLNALAVQHAQEAATVLASPSAVSDPSRPFDSEPFVQTLAIVAGSRSFYVVTGFIAQMSMTDTVPNLSRQQLAQQIVGTFNVA